MSLVWCHRVLKLVVWAFGWCLVVDRGAAGRDAWWGECVGGTGGREEWAVGCVKFSGATAGWVGASAGGWGDLACAVVVELGRMASGGWGDGSLVGCCVVGCWGPWWVGARAESGMRDCRGRTDVAGGTRVVWRETTGGGGGAGGRRYRAMWGWGCRAGAWAGRKCLWVELGTLERRLPGPMHSHRGYQGPTEWFGRIRSRLFDLVTSLSLSFLVFPKDQISRAVASASLRTRLEIDPLATRRRV